MRIGPKMNAAASYAAQNPGCSIADICRHIANWPNGWRCHYPVVWRARAAGLVTIEPGGSSYRVFAADGQVGGAA
jgi:hypothetical protein